MASVRRVHCPLFWAQLMSNTLRVGGDFRPTTTGLLNGDRPWHNVQDIHIDYLYLFGFLYLAENHN